MIRSLILVSLAACNAGGPGDARIPEDTDTDTDEVANTPPTLPTDPCEPFDPAFQQELQAGLEAAMVEQGFPGAALAVNRPSTHQCWASTVGDANLEGPVPWTVETPYPIGSVSKTFTTAILMQLAEEGVLTLDDPIEDWVTTVWAGEGLTLRHLMQHTSGIVSYNYVGSMDKTRSWTPQELVDWAAQEGADLLFAPGSTWEYSNTNFVLLGMTIEAATGRSFETELQERLLDPVGLNHTWMATENPPDLVRGYIGDPLVDSTDTDHPTIGWAAGGIISTPAEAAAWGAALFRGGLLSPATLTEMTTPLIIDDVDVGYGLGLFGTNDPEFGPHWGHTGGTGGHVTYMYYLERNDAVVVAMLNTFEHDLDKLAEAAWIPIIDGGPVAR